MSSRSNYGQSGSVYGYGSSLGRSQTTAWGRTRNDTGLTRTTRNESGLTLGSRRDTGATRSTRNDTGLTGVSRSTRHETGLTRSTRNETGLTRGTRSTLNESGRTTANRDHRRETLRAWEDTVDAFRSEIRRDPGPDGFLGRMTLNELHDVEGRLDDMIVHVRRLNGANPGPSSCSTINDGLSRRTATTAVGSRSSRADTELTRTTRNETGMTRSTRNDSGFTGLTNSTRNDTVIAPSRRLRGGSMAQSSRSTTNAGLTRSTTTAGAGSRGTRADTDTIRGTRNDTALTRSTRNGTEGYSLRPRTASRLGGDDELRTLIEAVQAARRPLYPEGEGPRGAVAHQNAIVAHIRRGSVDPPHLSVNDDSIPLDVGLPNALLREEIARERVRLSRMELGYGTADRGRANNRSNRPRGTRYDDHGDADDESVRAILARGNAELDAIRGGLERSRREYRARNDRRTSAASRNAVAALPTSHLDADGEHCGICLEEKDAGEEVKVLPCFHWFCQECIEEWLDAHGTCPTCRARVE